MCDTAEMLGKVTGRERRCGVRRVGESNPFSAILDGEEPTACPVVIEGIRKKVLGSLPKTLAPIYAAQSSMPR